MTLPPSSSPELHKIKVKIMALANKTTDRGCSEEEAMSAMEKIGKLLEAYDLTMEECDMREEKCVSVKIPLRGARSGAAKLMFGISQDYSPLNITVPASIPAKATSAGLSMCSMFSSMMLRPSSISSN
jgi:Protein of unknown function (DUF2786)